MIIYKDLISGDELISDSFDLKEIENGAAYEVKCRKINIGGESINVGGNPSAEGGADEGTDDAAQQVVDVVHSFRLHNMGPMIGPEEDKKDKIYKDHLKVYLKKIKAAMKEQGKSDEEIKAFETRAARFAKKIIRKLGEIDFYVGESMDPESMQVPFFWEGDDETPTAWFWKDGMSEMKV